jgi:regulator of replication initiation timing
MSTVQLVAALLAACGGLGGLATSMRAKAQNHLDGATARERDAKADSIAVDTARDLIDQIRTEMNRRVSELDRELGRLRGQLEDVVAERNALREENRQLKGRVDELESRIRVLTAAKELTEAAVDVHPKLQGIGDPPLPHAPAPGV